jgi:hypothetical protein
MPDQQGQPCAEHPRLTCFCDEERDRAAGIHRPTSAASMFGGYECTCGEPWLTFGDRCMGAAASGLENTE